MPSLIDHGLAAVLVIAVPGYAAFLRWPRLRARLAAGDAQETRIRAYWRNIGLQWLLVAACLGVWRVGERPWADLGFAAGGGWRFWVALGAAVAIAVAVTVQYVLILRRPADRARLREQLGHATLIAPHSTREMLHFTAFAVTAGICEEILYRGFLLWYLTRFTGTTLAGLIAAVAAGSLVFAACHLYQGPANAVRIGGLSLVTGAIYLFGGSLLPVVLLHAHLDIAGGLTTTALSRSREPEPEQ